jgi:uncharacterized protein (DUF58 family)
MTKSPDPSLSRLVPSTITASARAAGRARSAFGPRFFIGIIVGLVWIGPAWWDARFVWAMAAWNFLMLCAWAVDWRRLPRPEDLTLSRIWYEPLSQGEEVPVALEVSYRGTLGVEVFLEDSVPSSLSIEVPSTRAQVPPATRTGSFLEEGRARLSYTVSPADRGDVRLGPVFLRYQSPLRLAERWASAALHQVVRVYPNLQAFERDRFYLMRSRQIEMERRFKRQPGLGREFESLRDYREGDEPREICWTATARRAKLISRVYRVERSQTVLIVLDAGRLMLARVNPVLGLGASTAGSKGVAAAIPQSSAKASRRDLPPPAPVFVENSQYGVARRPERNKLDYAVSAALGLASVALHSGDSVGLLAYGRKVSERLPGGRGARHLRAMVERLATVHGELVEADHAGAADVLLAHQRRRSLVVWLTDLAETAATPEVIESAARLVRRHLVVFAAVGQPELGQLLAQRPATVEEMYRYVAAQEMVERRQLLLHRLRRQGALTLEVTPGLLASAIVNRYLEVKERTLL